MKDYEKEDLIKTTCRAASFLVALFSIVGIAGGVYYTYLSGEFLFTVCQIILAIVALPVVGFMVLLAFDSLDDEEEDFDEEDEE